MIFNSIRWRLQLWHGLILVIVLAAFGFSAYHVTRDNQLRRADQDLDQSFMTLFRPEPPKGPPNPQHGFHERFPDPTSFLEGLANSIKHAAGDSGSTNATYFVLWQADGTLLARSPGAPPDVPFPAGAGLTNYDFFKFGESNAPPDMKRGPPMKALARTRGDCREAFRAVPFGGCILAGRSLARERAALDRLAVWLAAAGAGILLLGLAGGWWLATKAIAPIDEISATALKISAGDLSRRINVREAESELGRLAAVLNSTFSRLEAAFAHQARFTADASHELRTPLSVILTQGQNALSRERDAAEYRSTIEACLRAAQRMRALTDSLLQLARLDAGQEPMKRERFDLAATTRDCVELLRPLAQERGIALRCELPPLDCIGDPERIGQVVTNLISNAIHHNREQGEVSVSGAAADDAVSISVSDTGEGLAPEVLPHIFERFYRVEQSRSRSRGGNGLGLAISKAIVDAHSGTLEVSSKPGVGSTFVLKLPRSV
jgi:signal transduction histidine kinase